MSVEVFTAEPGRLDAVVARLTGLPRADVQRAIAAGEVLVDGTERPKSFRLRGGERLEVEIAAAPAALEPEGPPVAVRAEDDHFAVIDKPGRPAIDRIRPRRSATTAE